MSKFPRARMITLLAGLIVVISLALLAAGCAPSAQATPTPTKTPRPEATQAPAATATPVPPTPRAADGDAGAAHRDAPRLRPPIPPPPTTAAPETAAGQTPAATPAPAQPANPGAVATLPPRAPGVSIFTGLRPADPAVLNRRPVAVKVDNDPAVVPQSGMGKADVVVETRKEGCLTRFTAIYQSQSAPKIGPVRSARLVDVELPVIFDAVSTVLRRGRPGAAEC